MNRAKILCQQKDCPHTLGLAIWFFKAVIVADSQKTGSGCGQSGAGASSEGTVEGLTAGGICLLSNDGDF